MKQCHNCKTEKPLNDFYSDKRNSDGKTGSCKACHNSRCRLWQEKNKKKNALDNKRWRQNNKGKVRSYVYKYKKKYPEREKALKQISHAIENGKYKKRNICEICYSSPSECHHPDYSKPMKVIELCKKCHSYIHSSSMGKIIYGKLKNSLHGNNQFKNE